MTQREAGDVREYYRLITEVDIGDVARELLAERIWFQQGHRFGQEYAQLLIF